MNHFCTVTMMVITSISLLLHGKAHYWGCFLTSYHLAPLWGPSPFDLKATFSQFTLHLTSFDLLIPTYWLLIHLLSLHVTHLYLWVTKINPHATLNVSFPILEPRVHPRSPDLNLTLCLRPPQIRSKTLQKPMHGSS